MCRLLFSTSPCYLLLCRQIHVSPVWRGDSGVIRLYALWLSDPPSLLSHTTAPPLAVLTWRINDHWRVMCRGLLQPLYPCIQGVCRARDTLPLIPATFSGSPLVELRGFDPRSDHISITDPQRTATKIQIVFQLRKRLNDYLCNKYNINGSKSESP